MIPGSRFLLAGIFIWLGFHGVASDTACKSLGGSCRYTRTICTGYHLSGKCSGPSTRKCCVPAPSSYDDSGCKAISGTCQINSATCHGGTYRSSLCGGSSSRQCCAPPAGQNPNCLSAGGRCFADNLQCPGHFKSGLCSGASNIKCCVNEKCSTEQQNLACELFRSGNVEANQRHPSGQIDNAFPYNNLRDMCNGKLASMSGYRCNSQCYAPNAKTCLSLKLLKYLKALIANGQKIKINELAGACHSCGSRHYSGLAVDLYPYASQRAHYVTKCKAMGGYGLDERSHVHCQFYDGPHQNW